jgi:peptide/nickel transport system substrate-binding protein
MTGRYAHLIALAGALALASLGPARAFAADAPAGQMTWALHFTLAPSLIEPAETPGLITPFMFLYALHDALVKPLPDKAMAPSLAESWSASPDGLVHEFVLRRGVRFHNGDPVTAEDVKFSFERYRGISAKVLKDRVAAVETPDARRVRFRLKHPWPDFLSFYATPATGAAWIVPKRYVEKVGEDGFKKAPIGAGPYRFVSSTPGVDLVLEAFDGYWRKTPSVKRLVFRSIPDGTTRLAMLKRGEVDVAYAMNGELGEEVQRTPGLTLRPTLFVATHWLVFADQWDQASPWHDRRVRLAANLSVDRRAVNQAVSLGSTRATSGATPAPRPTASPCSTSSDRSASRRGSGPSSGRGS